MTPKRPAKRKSTKAPRSPIDVSDRTIRDLTAVFKLLADKSRLKIVLALTKFGRMHVSALCDLLHQTQPAVSHHLTLMRMVGLVGYDRDGKHNFYYLANDFLGSLVCRYFSEFGQKTLSLDGCRLTFDDNVLP